MYHFTDGKTEALRGEVICLRPHSPEIAKLRLNPGSLSLEPVFQTAGVEGSLFRGQSYSQSVSEPSTASQATESFARKANGTKNTLQTGPKGERVKFRALWNGEAEKHFKPLWRTSPVLDVCCFCLPSMHCPLSQQSLSRRMNPLLTIFSLGGIVKWVGSTPLPKHGLMPT